MQPHGGVRENRILPANTTGSRLPRTAFVLSGGASLGAIQVGMVRALFERRVTADLLVGTSVGALNAAFIASRPPNPRERPTASARLARDRPVRRVPAQSAHGIRRPGRAPCPSRAGARPAPDPGAPQPARR